MTTKPSVSLKIILEKPTPGVDFGLQKGKGNVFETVQKQRSGGKDLVFEFDAALRATDKAVLFSGPFVQGPADTQFVYIDIGTIAGQTDSPWQRRLKIPLSGFDQALLRESLEKGGLKFETKVPGVGKDGGPNCATVKPFAGWRKK